MNKCSFEEHKEIEANIYCPECQINMCKKCENVHNSLFKNHHPYNIEINNEEIFTGFCKEKNHHIELKYFCKNHNKLCCAACIEKINRIGDGQHKDCDVCTIQDIREEKKKKLKNNIINLENLNEKLKDSISELNKLYNKIDQNKEDLKSNIQKKFTKIRNAYNEREEELLKEIDDIFNKNFIDENLLKEGEKLPNKIKSSLEKVKSMDKEWENNNLNKCINNCIVIENEIEKINLINQQITKCIGNDTSKIHFFPNDNSINEILDNIKKFGKIDILSNNFKFRECPKGLNAARIYIVSGENKNILTKTGTGSDFAGTICEKELDKIIDIHRWKIKILKTKGKEINVGIASDDFNPSNPHWNKGYFLYCKQSFLYSVTYSGKNKNIKKVDNEVIVELNMKTKTLKFIIDGDDKIVAFTDIPTEKPLYPAVILYDKDDSVEIIKC